MTRYDHVAIVIQRPIVSQAGSRVGQVTAVMPSGNDSD